MKIAQITDTNPKRFTMAVAHNGSISTGLVLIPLGPYKTTVDNDICFNQLDKESKVRIKYKKYCSHCNNEAGPDDIIKGYEYEKDKYVVMTDDEQEKINPRKDKILYTNDIASRQDVPCPYWELMFKLCFGTKKMIYQISILSNC